jgi:hypothetical protein
MKVSKAQMVPPTDRRMTMAGLAERLRVVAAHRAEEILEEVAPTLRRLRTFLLVASISIPILLAGLVAVLWHAVH